VAPGLSERLRRDLASVMKAKDARLVGIVADTVSVIANVGAVDLRRQEAMLSAHLEIRPA
jgi:hypothetical protein